MGQNITNTKDRQSTDSIISQGDATVKNVLAKPKDIVQTAKSTYTEGWSAYKYLQKVILAETGVRRQRAEFPQGVSTTVPNDAVIATTSTVKNYSAQTQTRESIYSDAKKSASADPIEDMIFLCGDYQLPLSVNFSLSANKVVAESQLVDGVNIVERIANAPKTINVSIIFQRKENTAEQFVENATTITDQYSNGVYRLNAFIADLYAKDEVFFIENSALNNEFGVQCVFIKSFNFNPEQGSTFAQLTMQLQEVNIEDPLLYIDANAGGAGAITTSKNG